MRAPSTSCDHAHRPLTGDAHDHAHGHGRTHAHAHAHASAATLHRPEQRRALLVCIALTTAMMVVEIVGGIWTGSLMLLSDAAHMLSHSIALFVSYAALRLADREYDGRSHFGMYRAEILGALFNGIGVLVFTGWIAYEAVGRFWTPTHVHGGEMTVIATLGLGVNLLTTVILGKAGAEDLNTRSAFLHMLGDTLSSVAIVIGGFVLWRTGATWIDPVLSLLVALVILVWGVGLVRQSCSILLELAPRGRDPETVREAVLEACPDALDLHDLHIWEITSGYVCMTAHVVMRDVALSQTTDLQNEIGHFVEQRFHITHVTLQMECADGAA
jgi:cobalt-zinc-cadmium efflux system protein